MTLSTFAILALLMIWAVMLGFQMHHINIAEVTDENNH